MTQATKRRAGAISGKKWLVLAESTGQEGKGYKHKCGAEIQGKGVRCTVQDGHFPLSGSGEVRTVTIPYCPDCEDKPEIGFISPEGRIIIWK